ncbi:hypothetical protein FM036_08390 [Nostoc sp. HG1]|nr:hypothetical protein [Nostoc sp. HG1]
MFLKYKQKSLKVDNYSFFSRSNYPLNLILVLGSKLELVAHYDLRSFKTTGIKRILGHFKAVLNSMVAEPYPQLGTLINLIYELDKKEKALEMEALKYSSASKLKGIKPKAIRVI